MIKIIIVSILAIFVSACSSGSNDSTSTEASNFPNVAGRYSFNTSAFSFSCSDGSTGSNPPIAVNFDVSQNVNEIVLLNVNSGGNFPGITFIDSTDLAGNVQANYSFIATQIATANVDGIRGTVNLKYTLEGDFSSNGWSGTYTYSASSPSLGSCTFTATFNGSKIIMGSSDSSAERANESNYFPVNIYDQDGGNIGLSVGLGG